MYIADTQVIGDYLNNGTTTVQNGTLTIIGALTNNGTIIGDVAGGAAATGLPVAAGDGLAVIGDYTAGPSHVMPTGGTARFASSLGVHTFLRYQPIVSLNEATLTQIGPAAAALARSEGLTAHARAIERRLEGGGRPPATTGDGR